MENTKIYKKNIDYTSPYSYTNYEFVTENSVDIRENWIQYAENVINRAEYQMKLSNILLDVDIALKIELSIFEYSLIYCQNHKFNMEFVKSVYEDKFHNIVSNIVLTPGIDNKTFKNLLLEKKINPSYVAFLSPSQIHPDKWQYFIKKKEYIEQKENNISYSNAYKCYKCGESKAKVTQAQTRSADEPMTTFVTCMVCQNTFKFC
jgi:DNA-directed RNA polymerase subunit M/transcription elongation factor TFIIS